MTLVLSGTGVMAGIAIGRVHLLSTGELELPEYHLSAEAVDEEIDRLERAAGRCERMLEDMVDRLRGQARDPAVELLEAHRLMVHDELLLGEARRLISGERINAEWALERQASNLRRQFERMEDDYLALRIEDLDQVVRLLQQQLARQPVPLISERVPHRLDRTVVVAPQISPAELALLHQRRVAGLVTEHGGIWSHSAIVARALDIPMLVGVTRAGRVLNEGEMVILDGHYGCVMVTEESSLHGHYGEKAGAARRKLAGLARYLDVPERTRDGVPFGLQGNAELPPELERCRELGVSGIGLMRTEFLFAGEEFPDEETQYAAFRRALEIMDGRPVTIRTLDAGGDNLPPELARMRGHNPALGLRGVRLSLASREAFQTQLCAILRASVDGPVRILLPMLTNAAEIRQARELVSAAREELGRRGIRADPEVPLGGMIETPAAALIADELAGELDFLSVGTNDLVQYVLAVDREDELVSHLYDPLHRAVLELIARVVRTAAERDRPVEVCGEMAAESGYVRLLLGLGVTHFSVPPGQFSTIKARLCESHAERCREILQGYLAGEERVSPEQLLDQLEEHG